MAGSQPPEKAEQSMKHVDYLTLPLSARLEYHRRNPYPTLYRNRTYQKTGIIRDSDGTAHTSNMGALSLRFVGLAGDIAPSRDRHTGWYVDRFQDETVSGVVYRLPSGRGFLAGYTDPWNSEKDGSGPCNLEFETHATETEAARRADRLAELRAEFLREDSLREEAKTRADDLTQRVADIREEIRELVRGIRESILAPAVCRTMRDRIRALRAESREARREASAMLANPYVLLD